MVEECVTSEVEVFVSWHVLGQEGKVGLSRYCDTVIRTFVLNSSYMSYLVC